MSTSLLTLAADGGYAAIQAAIQRLRSVWFPIIQTSVASGLAWYIAADVLDHPQPFFAPIASAVCLSISNVLRAQRAVQMMIGVSLGIWIGGVVHGVIGTGVVPIAVAVLISLSVAVVIGRGFIGQGMMFINQTVASSILVLALYRGGAVYERIDDALIGGSLALVFAVLLFPANPLTVLRRARIAVLVALRGVLSRTADFAAGHRAAAADWPLSAVDRVHEQIGDLIRARTTAHQVVRISPRRWGLRGSVRAADHQALHLALLAVSVLQLARVVAPVLDGCNWLPSTAPAVLAELVAATDLAEKEPVAAIQHVAAARVLAEELHSVARDRREVVLADAVQVCIDDLERVIDLRLR
jgi:uncharacterized membrane protein YgaE (UPF0421/DUF939 family)